MSEHVQLSNLSGSRVGVDGTWLLMWLRVQLKRDDPYWCVNGPVSPAIEINIDKFINHFKKVNTKLVFVFDGLYTQVQQHPAIMPHRLSDEQRVSIHNPAEVFRFIKDHEVLDEDVTAFVIRALLRKGMEVVTAPYFAWAQLAYFAYSVSDDAPEYISEVIASAEALCFGKLRRVIFEIWDSHGELSEKLNAKTAPNARDSFNTLVDRYVTANMSQSVHWSWAQGVNPELIKAVIQHCPVFTHEGQLLPLSKVLGDNTIGNLREYFYDNLHTTAPLTYYFMMVNVLSPQLLAVVATSKFVDDSPLVRSRQYETTLERIIPLRTQIVFQFVQDLQKTVTWLQEQTQLSWSRWNPNGPAMVLPIHRPPKIALDEWADVEDRRYNFVTVLDLAVNARQYPDNIPFSEPLYRTENQATAAVLLKSLDLLGYFTHAAHAVSEQEVSSKSIFAEALSLAGEFADEAVLLIELTRTQSLHDADFGVDPKLAPRFSPPVPQGTRFVTRLMSLLPLESRAMPGTEVVPGMNADLLAFNEIARSFQRNLRYLTEVVTCTQLLRGSADFPMESLHTIATRLPFAKPLSIHAGRLLDYMLSSEYAMTSENERLKHLSQRFPYLPNLPEDLLRMKAFFDASKQVLLQLMNDEEADTQHQAAVRGYCDVATQLVENAFRGIVVTR